MPGTRHRTIFQHTVSERRSFVRTAAFNGVQIPLGTKDGDLDVVHKELRAGAGGNG